VTDQARKVFSLVVPTVGRPVDLLRFLDHLRLQFGRELSPRQVELIVVDQSGRSETRELLAEQDTEFEILHLEMAGRGASRARNYGWAFARGEIITFPDDDCHYPAGFLREVLRKFDEPEIDAIIARVDFMSRHEPLPGAVTRENVLTRCAEPGIFARREALGGVRFDERMGIGSDSPWNSDEGPDLVVRMLARGLRVVSSPDLRIHHPDPMLTPDELLQQRNFSYSRGRGYFLRKHAYPTSRIAWTLLRSLVGSLYMAVTAKPFWARYYLLSFVGKWQGLRGAKNAPSQIVTCPLSQDAPAWGDFKDSGCEVA
jgi:glycosyltransferase involved in cell wall biosynthesis